MDGWTVEAFEMRHCLQNGRLRTGWCLKNMQDRVVCSLLLLSVSAKKWNTTQSLLQRYDRQNRTPVLYHDIQILGTIFVERFFVVVGQREIVSGK